MEEKVEIGDEDSTESEEAEPGAGIRIIRPASKLSTISFASTIVLPIAEQRVQRDHQTIPIPQYRLE